MNSFVYYNGPMMQGFPITKALASSGLYNSQALPHWDIITNSGIYRIQNEKSSALNFN